MNEQTPAVAPYLYLVLLGLGIGGAYVTRLIGLLSSADDEKQAVIQAASWTISSTGFAMGVAAASAVFLRLSLTDLEGVLGRQPQLLSSIRASFEVVNSLGGREKAEVVRIYLNALKGVFYLSMGEMAVSALVSLCMENNLVSDEVDNEVEEKGAEQGSVGS